VATPSLSDLQSLSLRSPAPTDPHVEAIVTWAFWGVQPMPRNLDDKNMRPGPQMFLPFPTAARLGQGLFGGSPKELPLGGNLPEPIERVPSTHLRARPTELLNLAESRQGLPRREPVSSPCECYHMVLWRTPHLLLSWP
jgi:hypothetical protein